MASTVAVLGSPVSHNGDTETVRTLCLCCQDAHGLSRFASPSGSGRACGLHLPRTRMNQEMRSTEGILGWVFERKWSAQGSSPARSCRCCRAGNGTRLLRRPALGAGLGRCGTFGELVHDRCQRCPAPCATAEQIADVDAALTDAGLPLVFDTRTDKLLKSNDHGIQHLSDTVVPIILDVVGDAAIPCLGTDGRRTATTREALRGRT